MKHFARETLKLTLVGLLCWPVLMGTAYVLDWMNIEPPRTAFAVLWNIPAFGLGFLAGMLLLAWWLLRRDTSKGSNG